MIFKGTDFDFARLISSDAALGFGYFFIKSSTALLIARTPVRIVGSGTGANSLECGPGTRVPFSFASFNFAASTAPNHTIHVGGFGSSTPYKLKSVPLSDR